MNKIIIVVFWVISMLFLSSCMTGPNNEKLPPLSKNELKILKIMGGKVLPDGNLSIGKVTIQRKLKEVSFPALVNINEGDLEVLICTPVGRTHESLLLSKIDPYNLQLALLLLGAENGVRTIQNINKTKPLKEKNGLAQGTLFDIYIRTANGKSFPVEKWLKNKKTKQEEKQDGWVFVGSSFAANKHCLATEEGNIVNTWSFGNTILDNPSPDGDDDDAFEAYTEKILPYETPVTVIMKKKK